MIRILCISLSLFFFSAPLWAQDTPLTDPAKEQMARDLMKELRCLQCQNQSIDDSNADVAKDLRILVREQIAAGATPKEVKAFLTDRYGDWVLLNPPLKQSTWFLWGSPALILLLILLFFVFRKRPQSTVTPLTAEEQKTLAAILKEQEK